MNKNGLSTFVECGSCTPERQHSKKPFDPTITVKFVEKQVEEGNQRAAPAVAEVIANLLRRQQRIVDGQIPMLNIGNLVGASVRASIETAESVPYLTHLDFSRAVRELTDIADYTVLNLAKDTHSSGIRQYYRNYQSLDKLLKGAHKARVNELGKLAALEYEKHLGASGE